MEFEEIIRKRPAIRKFSNIKIKGGPLNKLL